MPAHHETRTNNTTDEWLTPPWILEALGPFDLDPCAPVVRPWEIAKEHYTEDGLEREWNGFVWCNPPYGRQTSSWLEKMSEHNNGIALVAARTETKAFFDHVWSEADSVLFLKGRLKFYYTSGKQSENSAGFPSVLVAYGLDAHWRLNTLKQKGHFLTLRKYLISA